MNPLFGELLRAIGYRVRIDAAAICKAAPDEMNFHAFILAEDRECVIW